MLQLESRVRLLKLSGQWLEELPLEEQGAVRSMIGEVFQVEDIDEHGHAWISKWWQDGEESRCHTIAVEADEVELVGELGS